MSRYFENKTTISETHRRSYTLSFLLFTFFLLIAYSLPLNATIRYVDKNGLNIPPYDSIQNAAWKIQDCIDVSFFGDTIYVANGVYEEQVVMIDGLSLIGAGTDSCVVDSRNFPLTNNRTITMKDSCLVTGFYVRTSNDFNYGQGIWGEGLIGLITQNKFSYANTGVYLFNSNIGVYNNYFINLRRGVDISNSNSIVRKNNIFTLTDPIGGGIYITAYNSSYRPVIDSNYIVSGDNGIYKSPGTRSTIINNEIKLINGSEGIFLHSFVSDSNWVYNNLIYTDLAGYAVYTNGSNHLQINNNYAKGNFLFYGLSIGPNHTVKNNVVTDSEGGVEVWGTENLVYKFNDVWNNDENYSGYNPDTTNLSVNPMIANGDIMQGDLDFHLQMYSPLIDMGDPTILDRDGSRSDIGLYGGPYGWTYTYQDLAPRPPHNLTAVIVDGLVKLSWNKNTEADFSHYRVYRDTLSILIYDSTKIIGETVDTFYYDKLPPVNHETRFYYVITAFDNQGNQSYPSEEINVLVTGLGEHPPKGYDRYRLLANYPNPFNPSTIIPYRLKDRGHVRLSIYDLKGELVRVLVNEWQESGYYEVVFHPNAEDKQKITKFEVQMGKTYSHLSSGMYIYSIQVMNENNIPVFTDMEKMILLK